MEWDEANQRLFVRAEGGCEICGRSDAIERHHRKRRTDGGDRLSNVVWLCPDHHRYVTEHPSEARRYGWIVSVSRDPLEVPFLWRRREWVYLDDEGNKTPLTIELDDAHA